MGIGIFVFIWKTQSAVKSKAQDLFFVLFIDRRYRNIYERLKTGGSSAADPLRLIRPTLLLRTLSAGVFFLLFFVENIGIHPATTLPTKQQSQNNDGSHYDSGYGNEPCQSDPLGDDFNCRAAFALGTGSGADGGDVSGGDAD